uniref:Protein DEK-like n=1 Tax=Phallusia mammillata TaxID=59560 RepID=A0A6F9DAM9_9ASCI|nr:protein DEK-like [Phallusia mammillata]
MMSESANGDKSDEKKETVVIQEKMETEEREEVASKQQVNENKNSSAEKDNGTMKVTENKENSNGDEKKNVEEGKETVLNDEDGADESEEELPPGLLEQPVEILKDKRERKKVARFTYDDSPAPSAEKKKIEIKEGKGIKLGDHPRVEFNLNRNKGEDLRIIHKLFFGVFGDTHHCKKNIRNFSGFTFEKDSPEYEKKEDYIGRRGDAAGVLSLTSGQTFYWTFEFTLDNLKWAMTVCDVENKKGKKDDLIDNLLEWCLCPKPSGKSLPKKRKRGEKKKTKTPRKPRKSKDATPNDTNTILSSDDLSSDSDSEVEEKMTSPKPAKAAKTQKSPASSTKKKTPQNRKSSGSPKKIAKIKIGNAKKDSVSSDDSDDEPLLKKSAPTNAQIRKSVEKILKGANLEEITMKAVCIKVYELYPDFDLSSRKPFIKETVKKIIS